MLRVNPRAACVEALTRWEKGDEFADKILHRALTAQRFSTLDRAFFTETFYGVIRNKRLLDFLIAQLCEADLDETTRQVLRLGLYQLLRMRIPHHAVVNETVELAGRARKLVNAVLRRCIRELDALKKVINSAPPGVRFSHPEVLIERWRKNFGDEKTHQLCEWNNRPAEIFVRANLLKVTPGELLRTADAEMLPKHPLMMRVKQIPLVWIVGGLCYVQDPSTLLACEMLDPQPGERVLDTCAAPGGKTTYLAQIMRNEGKIIACDASAKRLTRLRENAARLGVSNTICAQVDWLKNDHSQQTFERGEFDRILVDAPCSNTGVIRRRVDVRWRLTSHDEFSQMHETQLAMLRAVSPLLKPGGTLVYSTCSIEPEENEQLAKRAAEEINGLELVEQRETLPFRDEIDGAFAARFVRN